MRNLLLLFVFGFMFNSINAQTCPAGTTIFSWQKATTGTMTVVPGFTTAGGPPASVIDTTVGCAGVNNIITMSIQDPNNLYDRIRSNTSGTSSGSYGSPYFTIYMDNKDGAPPTTGNATTNPAYAAGGKILITWTFQHPVIMSGFRIDDVDASDASNPPSGSSSFQDRVVFSATNASGGAVPITLTVGAPGIVTIAGQTATANWGAGANNNVSPDDAKGQVTAVSTTPIKSFTMEYVAGPNETNPAQQAIRLGQFIICCPNLVNVSGTVFNDVNGLNGTPANTVDGTGLGNPAGTTLYASLTDPVTNQVIAVVPVAANGTYNFTNVVGASNYNVVVSTTPGVVGSPAPSSVLPAGWATTGENLGAAAGSDGTPNGVLPITVGTSNLTNANFGIEALPTPSNITAPSQANPGGTNNATVPPATFGGTDPNAGTFTAIRITEFPSNATSITINGTTYSAATFPPAGVSVPTDAAGQPTQTITVDPIDGNVTVAIPYKITDNAGKESITTGLANVPFGTISLSGTVYNDVNGLNGTPANTVDGIGLGNPASTPLYANLIEAGVVVGTVPVAANGTYNFADVKPNTNYTVQVTTNQGTIGSAAPTTALPTNWVNTGENLGATAGTDGTTNGMLPVTTGTTSTTNANFGIEEKPTANVTTLAIVNNPGSTIAATIPATAFGGTDPSAGTITNIKITAFPTDATTITINGTAYTSATFPAGGVTVPTNASGQPTQTITVDPLGTAATENRTVSIPYVTIDNAGVESTPGSVNQPFKGTGNIVSGNVYNDINGLNGTPTNTVDGIGTGMPSGTQLYAILMADPRNVLSANFVYASVPVNADGTYQFSGVENTVTGLGLTGVLDYTVIISTTSGTINSTTIPPASLPSGWVSTGENNAATAGSDGTVNGTSATFTLVNANQTNVNFGIEQPPVANNFTAPTQLNPGGTTYVTVPPSAFTGSDPSTGGAVTGIRFTGVFGNVLTIRVNGVVYSGASAWSNINAAFPNGIPVDANGNPTVSIEIDPNFTGDGSSTIPFTYIDAAGKASNIGTVTVPFVNVAISGNVYNDVNGLTDNTVNGTGLGNPSGTTMYANLLDTAGKVIATTTVAAGGAYSFAAVPGNATYSVQLSTNQGTVGSAAPAAALPSNWVNTGEHLGTTTGSDATVNGILTPVTVTTADVTNANFGIEQLPSAGTSTQPSKPNPGGSTYSTVPPTAFSGTDPNSGTITNIIITAFPSNTESIRVNGVEYTAATFPPGGITVPTNTTGNPTQTIEINPTDGTVTPSIPYVTVDNAGKTGTVAGAANVPFSDLTISGTVFDDGNGLSNSNVDGTPVGTLNGTPLYANLLDAAGTTVIATVPVNADGTYSFFGVTPSTSYQVQLSTNQGTVGAATPATALPSNWVNTGEDCCDNAGSDGTVNGNVTVAVGTTNATNANFGVNSLPDGVTFTAPVAVNPGGTNTVVVPPLTGTDLEDGTMGSGKNLRIDVVPTNADLYYNGSLVTPGTVITNYNPALLTIDPTGTNPTGVDALTSTFQYSWQDAAGGFDPVPNTVTLPFIRPGAISGTVFNDVDNSANNTFTNIQTNVEEGTSAEGQMYAYVYDNTTNLIIGKVAVNADGTFFFDGLPLVGNYNVYTTSSNASNIGDATPPALTVPAGWVNTTPQVRTVILDNPATTGPIITNVDFGIEQTPESFDKTEDPAPNPGGTNTATVPPTAFVGEDPSTNGNISGINITGFPTNATSININGTSYTSATFPPGGVFVPTDSYGGPTQTITVDPIDGALVNVGIPFATVDNAGKPDATPSIATLPFTSTLAVKYLSFTATKQGTQALLNFTIAQSAPTSTFVIERSVTGDNYVAIGTVQGTNATNYVYTDVLPNLNAKNYYRIKEIDAVGNISYSVIRFVRFTKDVKIDIYPLPANKDFNVNVNDGVNGKISMQLVNANGQVVLQKVLQVGNNNVNTNTIASGLYIVVIKNDNNIIEQRKVSIVH